MAKLSDLSRKLRLFLRGYRFREAAPAWSPLEVPVPAARVALITSAGLVTPEQAPFSARIGGDSSFRVLGADVDVASLIDAHRSGFDRSAIGADRNAAFPLDRLRELAAAGRVGEVAPRHLSFMGSLTLTGALRRDSAPRAADLLVEDGVDVALLVPV